MGLKNKFNKSNYNIVASEYHPNEINIINNDIWETILIIVNMATNKTDMTELSLKKFCGEQGDHRIFVE